MYEVRRQLLEKDETITTEVLKNPLRGTNEKSKMSMEIFQHHNDQMRNLVCKEYSPFTLIRYKTSYLKSYFSVIFCITSLQRRLQLTPLFFLK